MSVETFGAAPWVDNGEAFQPGLFEIQSKETSTEQPFLDYGEDFNSQVAELLAEAERAKILHQGLGRVAEDSFNTEATLNSSDNL